MVTKFCDSPITTFTHEEASTKLLEYLIDKNGIEIEKDDVHTIQALILGKKDGFKEKESNSFENVKLLNRGVDF